MWEEVLWPFLDAWDCASTQNLHAMEFPREIRGHMASFFFLLKKEPMVLRELVRFGPSIPVEPVKACPLVGLHMMAEEDSWRTDSGSSFSSSSSSENNLGDGALFVIGLRGSGDTSALFLDDWEVAKVAMSCFYPWTCCAKNFSKLKGHMAGLVFERVSLLTGKEVNDMSF